MQSADFVESYAPRAYVWSDDSMASWNGFLRVMA